MNLNELIKKISEYNPKADFELIKKAYAFAFSAHEGQKRLSGEAFIQHPLNVAYILADLKMDNISIAAGLLHDIVEFTEISLEQIKKEFGEEIAVLIDGTTKIKKTYGNTRDIENIRKMLVASCKDIRILIVKIAEILHNARTIKALPEEKIKSFSELILDVYAPLAYRLGFWEIKKELEDIAFKFLYPEEYKKIVQFVKKKHKDREQETKDFIELVKKELEKRNICYVKIYGSPKGYYSIYKKIQERNKTLATVYDLVRIRIIAKGIRECYETLEVIHGLGKPMEEKFLDFIANPKPSKYQSIHTAIIGENGNPIEVQIRTEEMHKEAEEGTAAHWGYKGLKSEEGFDKRLSWLRQVLDWQKEKVSAKEFIEFLKLDLFKHEIYVFTPRGDCITLPEGSTPVDFAYAVHGSIGDRCTGALVNDKIAQLKHELKNGDVVSILTSKVENPKREWLKFVKTSKAKTKIKQFLKANKNLIVSAPSKKEELKQAGIENLVFVEGVKSREIKIAKCCSPIPGDDIVASLTKSKKATLHKKNCECLSKESKSLGSASANWNENFNSDILIKVLADERVGLFTELLNIIAKDSLKVDPAKAKMLSKCSVECSFGIKPKNIKQVKEIITKLKKVKDVKKVFVELC